jgi:hypothetical protein
MWLYVPNVNKIHFHAKNRFAMLLAENISKHRSTKKTVSAIAIQITPSITVIYKKFTSPLKNKTTATNAGTKTIESKNG